MQRSEQIDLIHLQHMSWQDDCLVVKIHKSKKDQAGEGEQGGICTGRHVFACPSSPELCPILALALLIFCTPRGGVGSSKLFQGRNQRERFV